MAKQIIDNKTLLNVQQRVESIPPQALEVEIQRNMMALPQQPKNIALHFGVGMMMSRIGNQTGAAELLERAIKLSKNNEIILAATAFVYASRIGDHAKALKYLKKRQLQDRKNSSNLLLIANSQMELGKLDDALETLAKAEALSADAFKIHGMRSRCYMRKGDSEKARSEYNTIAKLDPSGIVSVGDMLAMLPDNTSEQMSALRSELQTAIDDNPDQFRDEVHKSMTFSALGSMCEKMGHHTDAFDYFKKANAAQPVDERAAGFKQTHEFTVLKEAFGPEFFGKNPEGHASNEQIFVVGMPRSGTTLIESILAGHPKVEDFGELEYFSQQLFGLGILNPSEETKASRLKRVQSNLASAPAEVFKGIGQQYIQRFGFENIQGFMKVDKMPHNFRSLGLIAAVFPGAKVIHSMRHPMDTCLSVFKNPLKGYHTTFAQDLETLGEYYIEYRKLMDFWKETLPIEIHEIRYEDMVSNPEIHAKEMISYLGLEWDAACLTNRSGKQDVATASIWQVREEIYTSSVDKWRVYEKQLAPLTDILKDEIKRYEKA